MEQKPSVGRIVHYTPRQSDQVGNKGQPYAAIITHVWSDTCVNLSVLKDGSFSIVETEPTSVNFGGGPRTWCWPPRV